VLENLTGGDWSNIDLMLVSGNPVALRQPLYTAFFTDRVEVPVITANRLDPRADDADEPPSARRKSALNAPAPTAAPPPEVFHVGALPPPSSLGAAANAEAEEASTQVLYRFPAKISLPTGHTMMVPFVDREVPATRTWLYQPETSVRHPLAAVRMPNDSDSGLPPGIVTAYEAAGDGSLNFVGDAKLPLLPKGTFRFVTFALDSKTDIRREDKAVQRTQLGKAVNGTLTLLTRSRRAISYEVTAPSDEDREIVIEEARAEGWKPASETNVEETLTRLRCTVAALKGQITKAILVLERNDSETVILTTLAAEGVLARLRGLQNDSAAVKDAVARLGTIVNDINKAQAQRTQLEAERKKIADDQNRIRQNLPSVGSGSDLGRRYLDTLKSQEDRLAEINRIDTMMESEIAAKRQSAEELARHLTL
jgi:hypothetical protein